MGGSIPSSIVWGEHTRPIDRVQLWLINSIVISISTVVVCVSPWVQQIQCRTLQITQWFLDDFTLKSANKLQKNSEQLLAVFHKNYE